MADTDLSLPMAVVPAGIDPATFYARFADKMAAAWSPSDGFVVWVAAEIDIARLYAPIKSAVRFAPVGTIVDGSAITADSVFLQTWPLAYTALKGSIPSLVPSSLRFENVDGVAVREAITPLYTAINRTSTTIDAFMRGEGLLKVEAGTPIGAAGPGSNPPSPATPNKVKIDIFDASRSSLNALQFFSDVAGRIGIDKTRHPFLSQLDLEGWVDVVVLDDAGRPIPHEPYTLYLADGSNRTGSTDTKGRVYETNVPAGGWAIEIPNHPSFAFLE